MSENQEKDVQLEINQRPRRFTETVSTDYFDDASQTWELDEYSPKRIPKKIRYYDARDNVRWCYRKNDEFFKFFVVLALSVIMVAHLDDFSKELVKMIQSMQQVVAEQKAEHSKSYNFEK